MTILHAAAPARGRRFDLISSIGVVVLGLLAGAVGSTRPAVGLALVLVGLGLCLVTVRPVLCAVFALPALYGYQSVGPGGLGVSDILILAGALLALPALAHRPALRAVGVLTRAFALYLVLLLPSLVSHPGAAAGQEVVHRAVIVLGAVLLGAWLAQEGQVDTALRLLLVLSAFFAVACVGTWLTNGQGPAYPFGYHKNYVGTLLALSLLLLLCAPHRVALPTLVRAGFAVTFALGLLAAQSRGAILGAALGGFIWLFAPRAGTGVRGRTRLLAAVLALGFSLYAAQSIQQQLTAGDVETNSVGVRRDVEAFTRDLWRTSPWDGVGLRYFSSGQYGPLAQAPNNAIDSELAESGLIGTTGFVLFHVAVLAALWRQRRTPLGLAALALFSGQLLHGMFDIYWSSGLTPLPLILAGMAFAEPSTRALRDRASQTA